MGYMAEVLESRYKLNISLKRLDTDYIDLYWLHRDDVKVGVDGIMESLNKFI